MMTMAEIGDLARAELDRHGLTDWSFDWDRAVRRAGCCHYRQRLITLSWPIFAIEANRADALDTILHEIAHALAGADAGHGPWWRVNAMEVGARPERCHYLATPKRVSGECGCDRAHLRSTMPGSGRRFRCKTCGELVRWRRLGGGDDPHPDQLTLGL